MHLRAFHAELPRRIRRRRRGKRGGIAVQLRLAFQLDCGYRSQHSLQSSGQTRRSTEWNLREGVYRWLCPVFPGSFVGTTQAFTRTRRGGVNLHNLRPLLRARQTDTASLQLNMALINARSLLKKTFILNDFFISQTLDLFLITETWKKPGELSPLSELVPHGCTFLNSPRLSGRGGGLLTVFKDVAL